MYFEGEELNARDAILRRLSTAQRKLVTAVFEPVAGRHEQAGRFDIILGGSGSEGVTPELD